MDDQRRLLDEDSNSEDGRSEERLERVKKLAIIAGLVFLILTGLVVIFGLFCHYAVEPYFELARFERGRNCSIVSVEEGHKTHCLIVQVSYQIHRGPRRSRGGSKLGWLRENAADLSSQCYSIANESPPCFNRRKFKPEVDCLCVCWFNPRKFDQVLTEKKPPGRNYALNWGLLLFFSVVVIFGEVLIFVVMLCS